MLSVDVEDIADVEGAAAAAKESFSTVKEVKVVIAVLDLVRIMAKGDPGGNLSVTMELDEGTRVLNVVEPARVTGVLTMML